MREFYLAVTYDVCEHHDLKEDMNKYRLNLSIDLDKQVSDFAKIDVAPLVKIYKSATSNFQELTLYKEYKFKEYECRCNQ